MFYKEKKETESQLIVWLNLLELKLFNSVDKKKADQPLN